IKRRVEVQRCPAVPTAPKTAPTNTIFKSACSDTMIALFPPNSKIVFPKRSATVLATWRPILVEPVNDTKEIRESLLIKSPVAFPVTKQLTPSGTLFFSKTLVMMFWQATAHKGVFELGFQTHTSPQTQASAAFHDQTATGKLKALIIPTIPSGWYCSYIRCIGLSECIVKPYNWRDKPTAKSQISIIS